MARSSDLEKLMDTIRAGGSIRGGVVRFSLLDEPQFVTSDVLSVTGIEAQQLQRWLARDWGLELERGNPGKGQRRMFTGNDILQIAAAMALQPFIPVRFAKSLAGFVRTRVINLLQRLLIQPGAYSIGIRSLPGDDIGLLHIYDGYKPEEITDTNLPFAYVILEVDELIFSTLKKLQAIVDGLAIDMPEQVIPPSDFFLEFDFDTVGRRVRVGLSFEETEEYERNIARDMFQRSPHALPETAQEESKRATRYLELHDKHELARIQRLEATRKDRAPKSP